MIPATLTLISDRHVQRKGAFRKEHCLTHKRTITSAVSALLPKTPWPFTAEGWTAFHGYRGCIWAWGSGGLETVHAGVSRTAAESTRAPVCARLYTALPLAITSQGLHGLWCVPVLTHSVTSNTSVTPWTVVPLSTGFPRLEYWSGLPFPSPGGRLNPGVEPGCRLLHWWAGSLALHCVGSPHGLQSALYSWHARRHRHHVLT